MSGKKDYLVIGLDAGGCTDGAPVHFTKLSEAEEYAKNSARQDPEYTFYVAEVLCHTAPVDEIRLLKGYNA